MCLLVIKIKEGYQLLCSIKDQNNKLVLNLLAPIIGLLETVKE